MTHAEAASNRDGRWMHDNYGPVIWGGTGERWDLLQLSKNGANDGGEQLRHRIQALLRESDARLEQELLAFRGITTIPARGSELSVQLDSLGCSWALASNLLERYELPFAGMQAPAGCSSEPWMSVQPFVRTVFRLRWVGRCLRCRCRAAPPR